MKKSKALYLKKLENFFYAF